MSINVDQGAIEGINRYLTTDTNDPKFVLGNKSQKQEALSFSSTSFIVEWQIQPKKHFH